MPQAGFLACHRPDAAWCRTLQGQTLRVGSALRLQAPLFRSCRCPGSPNVSRVQIPGVEIDQTFLIELYLELLQDPVEGGVFTPGVEQ